MSASALTSKTIAIEAPAKLNLYLHVLARREDGYHELDSLIAFANVYDLVQARPARDLTLAVKGPFASKLNVGNNNLVLRAARALQNIAKHQKGAELVLTKNLPVSAGIGGGSANAAAAIRALIRLWDMHQPDYDLSTLALSLGADVPVCYYGKTAYLGGIGERIDPGPMLPPTYLVIVNPGVLVSTPAVFKAREGAYSEPVEKTYSLRTVENLACHLAARSNGLTASAISIAPVIGRVLTALGSAEGCLIARMSGSGATCFGLFGTKSQAKRAASRIATKHPKWWIKAAKLLV